MEANGYLHAPADIPPDKDPSTRLWEHPRDSTSPSHNIFSSPSSHTSKLQSTHQIRPQLFPHFTAQQCSLSISPYSRSPLLNLQQQCHSQRYSSSKPRLPLCQLTNGRDGRPAKQSIKEASFPSCDHSHPTT